MQDVKELKGIEAMGKILIAGFRLRSIGRAINPIFLLSQLIIKKV